MSEMVGDYIELLDHLDYKVVHTGPVDEVDLLEIGFPGGGTGGGSIADLPTYSSLDAVQADITSGALVDGDFLLGEF